MTSSLVHRRPGLIALLFALVVGTIAITIAVATNDPAPAASSQVRDEKLGVSFDLPDGWTEHDGEGVYNLSSSAVAERPGGGSAFVAVGLLDSSLFAAAEPTLAGAARRLASDWGEFAIPVSGQRTDPVDGGIEVDGRHGWESGYRVVPNAPGGKGGYVQTMVVEDGGRRLYVLIIVNAADEDLLAEARAAAATLRFA